MYVVCMHAPCFSANDASSNSFYFRHPVRIHGLMPAALHTKPKPKPKLASSHQGSRCGTDQRNKMLFWLKRQMLS